jgi:hypothetical protein
MDPVLNRLLDIGCLVVVVDHVALVVDRLNVARRGHDLLGGAAGCEHPVRNRILLGGISMGDPGRRPDGAAHRQCRDPGADSDSYAVVQANQGGLR